MLNFASPVSSRKFIFLVLVILVAGVFSSIFYFIIFHPTLIPSSSTSTTMEVSPSTISLELEIQDSEGEREFRDVAVIDLGDVDVLLFRTVDSRIEKLKSLSLSGWVKLESSNKTYEIGMPCILVLNVSCPRVLMRIPGYDVPLTVEPGRYRVTIVLSWREARGSGKTSLQISPRAYDASMVSLGYSEPQDTTSWVTAEGSTRSYALLIDKVEDVADDSGLGRFKAYAWVFQSVGDDVKTFRFELNSLDTGLVEADLQVPVEKREIYSQVMLLIRARPGSYRLSIKYPVELSIDLRVEEADQYLK